MQQIRKSLPRYLLVGVGTSLLDLALFTLFAVGLWIPEIVANILSTIITVVVSYLVNRRFVFRAKRDTWASFFSFAGLTLFTGLVIQSVVIWVLVWFAQSFLPELSLVWVLPAAKIIAMGIGAGVNFIGYHYVFRAADR